MSLNYNIGFSTLFLIEEKIPLVKKKKKKAYILRECLKLCVVCFLITLSYKDLKH